MTDKQKVLATYDEAGYTMTLFTNGDFIVTHPEVGEMDRGCASMNPEAEDIGTYMDAWLEELRSLMAECDREFGTATNHRGQP